MLRDAQKCASVTEQAQRIGRSAAQAPHGLRRGMTSAGPCCSHDVRQRGYARVLAWHPPKREGSLLDLAQERSVPCESEALGCEKTDTPEVNLNTVTNNSEAQLAYVRCRGWQSPEEGHHHRKALSYTVTYGC